ncbi:MAG: aspartate aminotransferase family protein [Actinobacteria bacterium]|nr:MAG: aspartate aminotransferase family protein [Actinomycetota bacterium]
MSITDKARNLLDRLPPRLASAIIGGAQRIPKVRDVLDAEYEAMLDAAPIVRPDVDGPVYSRLPETGRDREEITEYITALADAEHGNWDDGHTSGAVYHGDADHIEFLNKVYALQSQSNPLHLDVWPSGMKFEAEVVAMTADMLGARIAARAGDEIVGTVTSGGTESIIMAMKAYRDRAGVAKPEMVLPDSAHVAFDKAAAYFGYTQIRVPVAGDFRADVDAMANAMTKRTIVVVGSTPGFPHGVIDPIGELSDMARERSVGFHTDACLGGFVLPWAERLGHDIAPFDFRLPGVTSMSADTHKYGYAAKGTSVVLYRGKDLRRHQFHVATEWPGGLYYSPTLAGSRPGGLVAAAWAALVSMGEDGYIAATKAILETGAEIRAGIEAIDGLHVLGDPLWVIAFESDDVDIFEIMARMAERDWSLNGLHHPPAVHLAVTLRHTRPGVVERFLNDLEGAVDEARNAGGGATTGAAPMYGMAATFPARSAVAEMITRYIDRIYEVEDE